MNDRELLEMAAKAAGMDYLIWTPGAAPIVPAKHRPIQDRSCWNPLTDDGDALRLASRLLIDMQFFSDDGGFVQAWCLPISDWLREDDLGDFPAATRRAIVRAAAEIGKGMP